MKNNQVVHPLLISRGFKPRKGEVFKCCNCGIDVYKGPRYIKQKNEKFCSIKCHIEKMKNKAFRKDCVICGKTFFCQPCQIKYRNRETCSMECRSKNKTLKALERRKLGGMTKHQIDRAERYSKRCEDWRKAVFERDDYTCLFCGVRGTYLEADHIKPFAFFPELRFELSNGRTLCRPCHNKTKISYKHMRKIYGKKTENSL